MIDFANNNFVNSNYVLCSVSRVLGEKQPGHYGGPRHTGPSAPASG